MNQAVKPTMRQQINLFNPAFQPQRKLLSAPMMGVALLLLAAGMIALSLALESRSARMRDEADAGAERLARKQARVAAVSTEFAPRAKSTALEEEIVQAEAQLAALRHVSGVLQRGELGDSTGFAGYLKAFARQSVPGLWLTGVTVAGNNIGIRGRTVDPTIVPAYINRLTQEPLLQGKSFSSLQIGQAEPVQALAADGKPAPASAPYVEFSLQSVAEGARP